MIKDDLGAGTVLDAQFCGKNHLFKICSLKGDNHVEIAGMNCFDFFLAIFRPVVSPFQYRAEDVRKGVENVKRGHLVRLFNSKGGSAI